MLTSEGCGSEHMFSMTVCVLSGQIMEPTKGSTEPVELVGEFQKCLCVSRSSGTEKLNEFLSEMIFVNVYLLQVQRNLKEGSRSIQKLLPCLVINGTSWMFFWKCVCVLFKCNQIKKYSFIQMLYTGMVVNIVIIWWLIIINNQFLLLLKSKLLIDLTLP